MLQMKSYAFNGATDAVLGIILPGRSADEVLELFRVWTEGIFSLGIDLPFTKFGKAMAAREALLEIIDEAIDVAEAAPQENGKAAKAFKRIIDARDEEGNSLSRDQIKDFTLTLIFAGRASSIFMMQYSNTMLKCHLSRLRVQ